MKFYLYLENRKEALFHSSAIRSQKKKRWMDTPDVRSPWVHSRFKISLDSRPRPGSSCTLWSWLRTGSGPPPCSGWGRPGTPTRSTISGTRTDRSGLIRYENWVGNLSPAMGQGIDSRNRVWYRVAKLHRLAGRYNNPYFLVPISERVYKPEGNSWTYKFVEVSGHNLESSQTCGFCVQCLHYKPVWNHFCSGEGGGGRGRVKSVSRGDWIARRKNS